MTDVTAPRPPSWLWLARHELRLAWRDWRSMLTGGGRRSAAGSLAAFAVAALALHLPAWAIIAPFATYGSAPDKPMLVTVSAVVLLFISLLMAQALELVTRSLYSRGDLDLVLSSPVPQARIFGVRIAANACLIALVGMLISSPFLDVLVIAGGVRWLGGFAVAASIGVAVTALAVVVTIGLFRLLGPRRTRVVAQIVSAVVGAGFAIGIQVGAILLYGELDGAEGGAFSVPPAVLNAFPDVESMLFVPARAVLGNWLALLGVVLVALAALAVAIRLVAPRFGSHAMAATDLAAPATQRRGRPFRALSPAAALRRKEWLLLRRDPWLVSQTLTQLLFLLPPALLLIRNFQDATGVAVVATMVLVTVGGQLAGALAWLAVSGEDAPGLIATAPVTPVQVTRTKVQAVLGAMAIVMAPFVLVFAALSPRHALFAAGGVLVASLSTISIQLWFRAQAKRTHFRRRHTSSRIATFGEALVSFSWAGAAGLLAAGQWPLATGSAVSALVVLVFVRALSPRQTD